MTLLEVKNLSVEYQVGSSVVRAVRDATFRIEAGETVGLVGETGSGKTATGLAILGLIPWVGGKITSGVVEFKGRNLLGCSEGELRLVRGRQIAMIPQDPSMFLNPVLTAGDQIRETIRAHFNLDRNVIKRRAIDLLRKVGIADAEERARAYPHQLSGGMKQRIGIAIALSSAPDLIIADEPTTGLDVTLQAQILALLKAAVQERMMAMILITHNLGVVAGVTNRVMVMYGGRIVESAPTHQLFARARHPYTFGLLRTVPRLDLPRDAGLVPIPGSPPDPSVARRGCTFAPRCDFAIDVCRASEPELARVDPEHESACWVDPFRPEASNP